jgi:hypothetical protein
LELRNIVFTDPSNIRFWFNQYYVDPGNYVYSSYVLAVTDVSLVKDVTNDTIVYLAVRLYDFGQVGAPVVSASYDENPIETMEALVDGQNIYVAVFRWNTTEVPIGSYVVSFALPEYVCAAGNVCTVPLGEIRPDGVINILDISATCKAFFSSTPLEDLNRDGVIDDFDVTIVSKAFGSIPENSRWNPDADMDKDGRVTMVDVSRVARVFGRKRADPNWNPLADLNNDRTVNILDVTIPARFFGYRYSWEHSP